MTVKSSICLGIGVRPPHHCSTSPASTHSYSLSSSGAARSPHAMNVRRNYHQGIANGCFAFSGVRRERPLPFPSTGSNGHRAARQVLEKPPFTPETAEFRLATCGWPVYTQLRTLAPTSAMAALWWKATLHGAAFSGPEWIFRAGRYGHQWPVRRSEISETACGAKNRSRSGPNGETEAIISR